MGFIKEVMIPIMIAAFLCGVVIGTPIYFIEKYNCTTFAGLQQTEAKYTLTGECYLRLPSGEWVTKDRWYLYRVFKH